MELVLNICWLAVIGLLFGSVFVAHWRGQLRLSLTLALACAAVLALLLFPAISMTDDLQQAKLLAEFPAGHTAGPPDAGCESWMAAFGSSTVLLFVLLLAMASALLVLLARLLEARKGAENRGRQQPQAVRPPPFATCLLAA